MEDECSPLGVVPKKDAKLYGMLSKQSASIASRTRQDCVSLASSFNHNAFVMPGSD